MNMQEKIARALHEAAWRSSKGPHASFESYDGNDPHLNPYRGFADAALAAMREPTEAMKREFYVRPESPEAVWHAVIDAAKSE